MACQGDGRRGSLRTMETDVVVPSHTRARFYRVLILLLPLYLGMVASLLPWSSGAPGEPLFTANYFASLRVISFIFPIWLGLLIVPSSALMAAALAGAIALYMAAVAGLGVLAERFDLHGLPIICAAFLAMPLLVAAWPRAPFKTWVERIALVLRGALLRGLAGLGAGLLALAVLWGALLLLSGLLQGNTLLRSLFGDATHVPMLCIGATLALLLAWEEWAEPLVRRFWALLLPLLLVLGVILAGVVFFLSNEQLDSLITAAAGLSIIAASLLFAAGTRKEPGLLTKLSRLATLPMVLLAGWLLGQAIVRNGWQTGYLHICLITTSVLLASARAWIVHFRPGLWLPEGTVTMLLPLIALVGMLQDPIPVPGPTVMKRTPVAVEMVWPVGATLPDGLERLLEDTRCGGFPTCRIVLQDLNGDGTAEVIDLSSKTIFRQGTSGGWRQIGRLKSAMILPSETVKAIELTPPRWQDLKINGQQAEVDIYGSE